MKTKLTLLIALCLTMAPLTWADEINVELDIIDDLKDVEAWEFRVLELEDLDRERTDHPSDELAENDEPGFDENDDIPERTLAISDTGRNAAIANSVSIGRMPDSRVPRLARTAPVVMTARPPSPVAASSTAICSVRSRKNGRRISR